MNRNHTQYPTPSYPPPPQVVPTPVPGPPPLHPSATTTPPLTTTTHGHYVIPPNIYFSRAQHHHQQQQQLLQQEQQQLRQRPQPPSYYQQHQQQQQLQSYFPPVPNPQRQHAFPAAHKPSTLPYTHLNNNYRFHNPFLPHHAGTTNTNTSSNFPPQTQPLHQYQQQQHQFRPPPAPQPPPPLLHQQLPDRLDLTVASGFPVWNSSFRGQPQQPQHQQQPMPQQQQQQQQPQIPLHETQPIISRPTEIFVPPQQTSFQSLLASPIEQDDLLDASIQQLSVNPDDWELFQQVAVTPDANLPIPPSFSSPAPIPTPLNEQAQYQSNTHQNTNVATQGLDRNRPIAQPSGYSLLPAHVSHRNSYPTGNNVNSGGNNSYNLPQQFQHTRLIHLDHKRLSHTSTAPYKNPTVSPVSPPLPAKRKSSSGSSATIASAADPTSAALTLVEPAAKTSSRRRKAVECMEECSSCGNPLALFNIRGPCKLINQGIIIETTCSECLKDGESSTMLSDNARRNSAQLPNSRQPSRKTRLPSASTGVPLSPFLISQQLECEICKSQFGFASVRPVHTEDAAAAASVTVEVVCKPCKEKWSFCTECGGGGKYRTGKYRPIELFPPSRRTCTLSHFRVGGAELVFQVYQGQDLPLDQLWAFADIFQDAFLSLYATPKIMRQVPAFATLASLKTFVTHAWKNAIGEVLSPNPSSLMWFCASGWIAHPTRAKAKGHRQSSSPRIETSVNPEGEKTLATTAAPEDPSPPPEGPSRSYVGLCAAQYLPETRSLYIAELAVLQSTQVQGIAQKLIFHTLDRLQASLGTWTPPPPPSSASDQQQQQEQLYQHSNDSNTLPVRYVWLLTRKVNIPMQRFAEKKGFLQKKAFITTYPHTKDVVDQFVKEGYSLDEYLTFVARVEDLVR